jgi:DNA-binding GntR family transcriptional regulator
MAARNHPVAAPRGSLADDAYTAIRKSLLRGEFKPGRRLSEPELALQFGTSRSPVREALMRLEHEGFIERAPSGYVRVKALDLSELEQLMMVRGHLEGLAVRLATPRLRTIDLDDMSQKLDEMERWIAKGDPARALTVGSDFHDVIMRECGNPLLVEMLSTLRARISRFRTLVASMGEFDVERIAEHRRILKALYQRNADLAEEGMVRHVARSSEAFITKFKKKHPQK